MSNLESMLETLPETDKNVIVILSGGLDSTTLTYLLVKKYGNEKVFAITFDYNQRHKIEIEKAMITGNKLKINHTIIPMKFLGDIVSKASALISNSDLKVPTIQEVLGDPAPITEIPYRNMLFLTLALSFAQSNEASHIFIGVEKNDLYGYWDTTPQFIKAINKVSELNRKHQIQIIGPFNNIGKSEEIELGNEMNVPFEDTHTCYDPDEFNRSCGVCGSCSERIKAFMDVKSIDPLEYSHNIKWKL